METKAQKIMLVDDDSFLLEMYAMKFKNTGYEVVSCVGPDDCINKLKAGENPDIFIFDLIMPKMDGFEMFESLKKQNLMNAKTVIVLTNQGQAGDLEKVKDMGIDGYIVKALHTPSEVVDQVVEISSKKS
jgi:CheY-like chemotaxis protein